MGRIKTKLAKRVGNKLIVERKGIFTKDFVKNKPLLHEHTTVHSKKLRNVIAGYLARLVRKQEEDKLA